MLFSRHLIFFSACSILLFNGCGKKVEACHPEYFGEWLGYNSAEYGDVQKITIDVDSHGKYFSYKAYMGFSGKVRIDEDNALWIGTHPFNLQKGAMAVDTAVDMYARNFYRYQSFATPGVTPMKMTLDCPFLWGRTRLTFYKIK